MGFLLKMVSHKELLTFSQLPGLLTLRILLSPLCLLLLSSSAGSSFSTWAKGGHAHGSVLGHLLTFPHTCPQTFFPTPLALNPSFLLNVSSLEFSYALRCMQLPTWHLQLDTLQASKIHLIQKLTLTSLPLFSPSNFTSFVSQGLHTSESSTWDDLPSAIDVPGFSSFRPVIPFPRGLL